MSDGVFYLLAFIVIVALAGLAYWIARQSIGFDPAGLLPKKPRKRLELIETKYLGQRHKLVLVRRDDVEHLILTGGPVDMIVETGIPVRNSAANGAADPLSPADGNRNDTTEPRQHLSQNGSVLPGGHAAARDPEFDGESRSDPASG